MATRISNDERSSKMVSGKQRINSSESKFYRRTISLVYYHEAWRIKYNQRQSWVQVWIFTSVFWFESGRLCLNFIRDFRYHYCTRNQVKFLKQQQKQMPELCSFGNSLMKRQTTEKKEFVAKMSVNSFKPSKHVEKFRLKPTAVIHSRFNLVFFISSKRTIWIEINVGCMKWTRYKYRKYVWNSYLKLYVIQSQKQGKQCEKCNSQSLFQL